MNNSEAHNEYMEFLETLIEKAGEISLKYFRSDLTVTDKNAAGDKFDPVTRADKEVEAFIRERISKEYPDHAIVGEEFGAKRNEGSHTWLIDPIDGTRGFISGSPMWGVLIGLKEAEECLVGALRQPYVKETYVGNGKTAYFIQAGKRARMKVRWRESLSDAIVCCTHPSMYPTDESREKFMRVISKCQFSRFGTECLGYGMLASGYVDLVVEGGLSAYDIMPLIPIVEGAGGIVTDWQGNTAINGGFIIAAGNKKLHDEVMELLN